MKKRLFIVSLLSALDVLWLSPLQAMLDDREHRMTKVSTTLNRQQRDSFLQKGHYCNAAVFAQKVINETPESPDNEDATIEDFRIARDVFTELAKEKDAYQYINDAIRYADGATNFNEVTNEDFMKARTLHLQTGNLEQVQYYDSILFLGEL